MASRMYKRRLLTILAIAVATYAAVFLLNGWFHQIFLPSLRISNSQGDAVGSLIIVFVVYLAQRTVSQAIFRDSMYGVLTANASEASHAANILESNDEITKELLSVRSFHDVLRNQLDSVTQMTEQAAYDITERLQSIDGVVDQLNSFVLDLANTSDELNQESRHNIADNQALIQKMDSYIRVRLDEAINDQQRIEEVVKQAEGLGSLVQFVKHISSQTNLLALNAAIEAARAGEAGRGFAVVADEVRKLSTETDNAVNKINDGINSVAESIRVQFRDKLTNSNVEAERATLTEFANQLSKLGNNYQKLLDQEQSVMSTIKHSTEELSGLFMNALASVQFQDITRQQIEQVHKALTLLDNHFEALAQRIQDVDGAQGNQYTPLSQHLEQLYTSYVMETQRSGHDEALHHTDGNGSAASAPKIELF